MYSDIATVQSIKVPFYSEPEDCIEAFISVQHNKHLVAAVMRT